jgi:hypothetical protein
MCNTHGGMNERTYYNAGLQPLRLCGNPQISYLPAWMRLQARVEPRCHSRSLIFRQNRFWDRSGATRLSAKPMSAPAFLKTKQGAASNRGPLPLLNRLKSGTTDGNVIFGALIHKNLVSFEFDKYPKSPCIVHSRCFSVVFLLNIGVLILMPLPVLQKY